MGGEEAGSRDEVSGGDDGAVELAPAGDGGGIVGMAARVPGWSENAISS